MLYKLPHPTFLKPTLRKKEDKETILSKSRTNYHKDQEKNGEKTSKAPLNFLIRINHYILLYVYRIYVICVYTCWTLCTWQKF